MNLIRQGLKSVGLTVRGVWRRLLEVKRIPILYFRGRSDLRHRLFQTDLVRGAKFVEGCFNARYSKVV